MPEKENTKSESRVDRFVYSKEDVKHIFRLGSIGGVFGKKEENVTILLKKLISNDKKWLLNHVLIKKTHIYVYNTLSLIEFFYFLLIRVLNNAKN